MIETHFTSLLAASTQPFILDSARLMVNSKFDYTKSAGTSIEGGRYIQSLTLSKLTI